MASFHAEATALNSHRGKGQQKVTVEHVHVHQGGQAIVGKVETPGGGESKESKELPHAIAYAPSTTMPSTDPQREPVQIASDEERPVHFELPPMREARDAVEASAAIVAAVAAGQLTPSEAAELSKIVESYTRILQAADFETRLAKVEKEVGHDRHHSLSGATQRQ